MPLLITKGLWRFFWMMKYRLVLLIQYCLDDDIVTELQLAMASTIKKTLKVDNLLEIISDLIASDRYRYSVHALDRMTQRNVTRPEVLQVLKKGRHEKIKDVYDEKFKTWNYAIRGKTIDKKELRIVISLDSKVNMIVITVIKIAKVED